MLRSGNERVLNVLSRACPYFLHGRPHNTSAAASPHFARVRKEQTVFDHNSVFNVVRMRISGHGIDMGVPRELLRDPRDHPLLQDGKDHSPWPDMMNGMQKLADYFAAQRDGTISQKEEATQELKEALKWVEEEHLKKERMKKLIEELIEKLILSFKK